MARVEPGRTVQPSVLDRLIDTEPRLAADPPTTWEESVRQLKASLRRDLEWLLNTRRTPEPAPPHLAELARSLYHYGLPDITALGRDALVERRRLQLFVEETIERFEPRLANVRITLVEQGVDGGGRELRFHIEALLRMDPTPERVVFDTVLEVASGEYQVEGELHA